MNKEWAKLARRIKTELADLEHVVARCEKALARTLLDEYRALRHVVRIIYTFSLQHQRLEELTLSLRPTYFAVRRDLGAFADVLEQRSKED
jgi:hypothetical protein